MHFSAIRTSGCAACGCKLGGFHLDNISSLVCRRSGQSAMKSLPIWIFWLLATLAVGGTIGAWLSDDGSGIFVGIVAGGITYSCFSLWRNW
jgi:hypothetical protein